MIDSIHVHVFKVSNTCLACMYFYTERRIVPRPPPEFPNCNTEYGWYFLKITSVASPEATQSNISRSTYFRVSMPHTLLGAVCVFHWSIVYSFQKWNAACTYTCMSYLLQMYIYKNNKKHFQEDVGTSKPKKHMNKVERLT